MHRRARAALLFALLLAAGAASARAQGNKDLEGRVILPNGTSPPNSVRVTLTYNGRRIQETFTDLSGRFSFTGIGAGSYRLTAEGDGLTFETTSVAVEVTTFEQGISQNIHLRPKAGNAIPAAGTVDAEEIDPDVPEAAREPYRQGLKAAAASKPEQAVKLLAAALDAHPPFYAAHLASADQLAKLKRYDEALAAYRRASELKPARPEAYVGVGVTLVNQKRYDEGIQLLRRVVELDDRIAPAFFWLGYAEMETGDHAAAERHLRRTLELARQPLARVYLANVYERTGEPAKAAAQLEEYLREEPKSPNAEAVRGAIEKLRRKAPVKK